MEWLGRPALRAVIDALGGEALVVGGAVRNACLGRPPGDIDLATPLEPEEVTRRLEAAGLKAVPTGIEHGTVTAVSDGEAFEVTTFRADVETDGRHAVVRFSTTLEEDAARRDFTINALYLRPDGTLVDPLGGLDDLRARRIRFIGDARTRIREDYLRILRFFRFSAYYAEALDREGLAACSELAEGLDRLARERIGAEMRRLLAAPDPVTALDAMAETGVLGRVLPGADATVIPALVALEQAEGNPPEALAAHLGPLPDWRVRLAALGSDDPAAALRLSRDEARFLDEVAALLTGPAQAPAVEAELAGAEPARAAALIRAARNGTSVPQDLHAALLRGVTAELPISARDLMAEGMTEGPALGRALERARAAWRASEFSLDKAALLREALSKGH